jgi:IclR family acetate operon transcriptional repressor
LRGAPCPYLSVFGTKNCLLMLSCAPRQEQSMSLCENQQALRPPRRTSPRRRRRASAARSAIGCRAWGALDLLGDRATARCAPHRLALGQGLSRRPPMRSCRPCSPMASSPMRDRGQRRYRLGLAYAAGRPRRGQYRAGRYRAAGAARAHAEIGLTSRRHLDEGYAVVVGRIDAPGAVRFGRRWAGASCPIAPPWAGAAGRAAGGGCGPSCADRPAPARQDDPSLGADDDLARRRVAAMRWTTRIPGVACIGACVFDRNGRRRGHQRHEAARLAGPAGGAGARRHRCAARISRQLGGDGPPEAQAGVDPSYVRQSPAGRGQRRIDCPTLSGPLGCNPLAGKDSPAPPICRPSWPAAAQPESLPRASGASRGLGASIPR